MSDVSNPGVPTIKPGRGRSRPKVEPFARYKGTSAWRKYRRRVRAYAWFLQHAKGKTDQQDGSTHNPA